MSNRKLENLAPEADSLQAYLRAISGFPRLSLDEERALARRIHENHDDEALKRLIESNLRFVVSYVKRYRGLGVSFLDLIHEGNLGLIEGARRFDPNRNVKYITYAVWWVRQAVLQALSDQARAFSVPPKLSGRATRFGRDVASLTAHLERSPTNREIAEDLDISETDVDTLLHIQGDDMSLSHRLGSSVGDEEGPELGDTLEQHSVPPVDHELLRRTLGEHLRSALGELEQKERAVMELRFGLDDGDPRTLQEIGERLHLSRERIRQIESRAKEKLRRSTKARELRGYLN